MKILLTGGTGLLGRALCSALLAQQHQLTVLSRQPKTVASLCGKDVQALHKLADWLPDQHFDAVINLAGAPIIDLPWTSSRKQLLWDSRVSLTHELLTVIARAERKPGVFLSGSAIGYYGDCGNTSCSDLIPPPQLATDFGATLCRAWEAAALGAEDAGVRVCLLRTGLVLAPHGGLLARMRLPFSLGLGGRLGSGQQWMSWIQIEDWVAAVLHLLTDNTASGAYNLTSPKAVRNADFTVALGEVLNRPARLPAPALLLKLLLGQRAYLLLGGQRVLPDRLIASGYHFLYPEIRAALQANL